MTKAGEKLIQAAREAVKYAQCDHDWETSELDFNGEEFVKVSYCRLCNCRETMFLKTPEGNSPAN